MATHQGQDAALVRRLAKKYNLLSETDRVNVPELMLQNGGSMELEARNARHQFFAGCARKFRCSRILLAHHADDQAETILFNLLRGSYGLKGMHFSTIPSGERQRAAAAAPTARNNPRGH